ncbi:hypothetical protein KIW84_013075 [Lathyrus oleraceus]|uniref:Pre-mRNA polyadenylation factor Fip1 domain-containing protein n=1 Tax=Pisum sativum TaxID=3888 RepID=A0A9D5BJ51_PEA|nr:hypothetical protein KIW84_013075 [Pisum sativum]
MYRPIPFGKPWRLPGADITDYFNFGFDENTWKQYRLSMISAQEKFDQPVSESLQSRSSKCELLKCRAIQGSPGNDSGLVKSNIYGLSGVGELILGKNRNKSNSSSGSDVLSNERLANAKISEESSSQERNEMIPDVVKV